MKNALIGLGLILTTPAMADIPISIYAQGPYTLDLQVAVDGNFACNERVEVAEVTTYSHTSKCLINLAGSSDIQLSGTFEGDYASGSFDATYAMFDLKPWMGIMRDETLSFGTRLKQYHDAILDLDPEEGQWFRIQVEDVTEDDARQALGDDIVAALPSELKTFLTHNVFFGDGPFIGPASQFRRSGRPVIWPNLTTREREHGMPEDHLPPKGSELAAWYDRVLVVYELYGDGIAPIVFDPAASSDEPAFFWLDEDTRDIMPFVYTDGSPARALDVLLIPLHASYYYFEGPEWILEAARRSGFDVSNPNAVVVDSSNAKAGLYIAFDQDSRVPFFRTVAPSLEFSGIAWWVGR